MTLIDHRVMALLVGLFAIAIPAYQAVFDVNMRGAAKELAQTYKWLQDEAAMRNVTFRVAIDLDRGTWKVEAGDPSSLIYSTPEERETAEKDLESTMKHYTEREIAEDATVQEEIEKAGGGKFSGLRTCRSPRSSSCRPTCGSPGLHAPVRRRWKGADQGRPADDPPGRDRLHAHLSGRHERAHVVRIWTPTIRRTAGRSRSSP
jgi:hypothetical protein